HHVLDAGEKPAAGRADGVLLLSTLALAFRLHVSFSRHAGVGAVDRHVSAVDSFSPHRAGHPAQGKRPARHRARDPAAAAVPVPGDGNRREALSPDARLIPLARQLNQFACPRITGVHGNSRWLKRPAWSEAFAARPASPPPRRPARSSAWER